MTIPTVIISFIGILIICFTFGSITKHISEKKGYEDGFAWGFWLNFIGIIVVACKPDIRSNKPQEYESMFSQTQIKDKVWQCICGQENSDKLNYCVHCHRDRFNDQEEIMKCPYCGEINNKSNTTCSACHNNLQVNSIADTLLTSEEPAVQDNRIDDIVKKLSELHSKGIITDEWFNSTKAELLGQTVNDYTLTPTVDNSVLLHSNLNYNDGSF